MPVDHQGAGRASTVRAGSPVLIIGTERSGSNLLRLILNRHPDIAIPHPPHFMRYLAPLAGSYGDLSLERNRRALVCDANLLLRRHIHSWPEPVRVADVLADAAPSVFGVVAAFYERYRRAAGKSRWGCKSTFMVGYVEDVLDLYPDARFLWLVRDPRDVAVSARQSVFGPFHPYLTGRLWAGQQQMGRAALERWGTETVRLVRYEELVARPETVLRSVCAFLGIAWEPHMLRHQESAEARLTASLSQSWAGTDAAINADSVGRHRTELSARDRRLVESAAGEAMLRLGYVPAAPGPPVAVPSRLRIRIEDLAQHLRVEARSLLHDRNGARRLRRDATVRWLRVKAVARTVISRVRKDEHAR
ncbi:sulfotransferase family protein [Mangrovihabitans endophyticus]|uniref:Sulfotransferase family protein n=1 Tax=Mangrovihabitans endophyticus TaxID=1751298 RepID=A0A8J3BYV5_9ACTN|nr:sulfotransferase [Mangrovihabitans endophyticus]GGK91004.1 hypothetical protein GCM10012284_26070 [Mangrovihabitans endophyticus]